MTSFFLAVLFLVSIVFALHGWGRLLLRWCEPGETPAWSYATVVGMGTWLFAGGVLNTLQLSRPLALDVIFGVGLALGLFNAYRALHDRGLPADNGATFLSALIRSWFRADQVSLLPAYLAVVGVAAFLVAHLMPTAAFNFHDDFHTYMMRPVRMLQTGTLGGNPFDSLGVDSLGGQAFMQAFFIRWLPLDYVNGFDAVLCFSLSAFLLIAMARSAHTAWPYMWLALAVLVVINPWYVNISSLYSATLMVMAIVHSSAQFGKDVLASEASIRWTRAVPVGLLLGSLVTLKTPYALFAAMYFVTYVGMALFSPAHRSRARRAVMLVAAVAGLVVLPWLGVSWSNYATALADALSTGTAKPGVDLSPELFRGSIDAFLVLMLVIAAAVALYLHVATHEASRSRYLLPLFAACVASVASYVANVYVFGVAHMAVRYSIPVLIAVVSCAMIVLGGNVPTRVLLRPDRWRERPGIAVLGIALIGAGIYVWFSFSDMLMYRVMRAHYQRTIVSFPFGDTYVPYNQIAMSNIAKTWVQKTQATTDAGQPILAWMSVPFQLDFVRNKIYVVTEPGLINPWLRIPLGADQKILREYLRRHGIRYVILEYKGYGMKPDVKLQPDAESRHAITRRVAEHNLYFRHALLSLANESRVLFQNGKTVVFDLETEVESSGS